MATNKSRKICIFRGKILSEWQWAASKRMECGYIVYNFGEVWCSNSRETFAYFCTLVKKIAKMGISSRLSQNALD